MIENEKRKDIGELFRLANEQMFFRMACQWCGSINHSKVPIVAKNDTMDYSCDYCHKVIVDFHYHEADE